MPCEYACLVSCWRGSIHNFARRYVCDVCAIKHDFVIMSVFHKVLDYVKCLTWGCGSIILLSLDFV